MLAQGVAGSGVEKRQDEYWDGTGPGWGVRGGEYKGSAEWGQGSSRMGWGSTRTGRGDHRDGTGRQVQDHQPETRKQRDQREDGAGTGGDSGLGQWR